MLRTRLDARRTRLANAFSKMVENHAESIALYFMYYNFGRIHQALRVTPAMEAGVANHVWSVEESSACSGELHLAADLAYWDQAVVTHHVVTSATLSDHEVVTLRNELIPRFNHGLQQLR